MLLDAIDWLMLGVSVFLKEIPEEKNTALSKKWNGAIMLD